ncbi:MAG: hypothetical protein BGO55_03645 [Sphingobacteriales bacterium 50-39]|nr:hypothetical protein [Sphingobacteriales bacterium]OJW55643.1 MAG: hypothetical protein BGO55_03645 [Sphingobacteriales bacterium 50-39]
MQKIFLFLVIISASKFSFGQQYHPQSKQEIFAACMRFMDAFKASKYENAFRNLRSYSAIEDYKIDTLVKKVKEQMTSINSYYGKALSYEEISEKDVKNSLIRLVYLVKYEKYFLKLVFILYNNGSYWTISNFKYTEDIADLF